MSGNGSTVSKLTGLAKDSGPPPAPDTGYVHAVYEAPGAGSEVPGHTRHRGEVRKGRRHRRDAPEKIAGAE